MKGPLARGLHRSLNWIAAGVVISVGVLAWLGYRAVAEWQHSARLVAQRTADTSADLLLTALTRDMRAVQRTVLSSLAVEDAPGGPALDLNAIASVFARYPYPEAFFIARVGERGSPITFYTRTNRQPPWLPPASADTPFPVVTNAQPPVGRGLLERIAGDVRKRKSFSAFQLPLGGAACQVVALLEYRDTRPSAADVRGFVVNLDWVRQSYFGDLTSQIARMRIADPGLRLAVMDAAGGVRASAGPSHDVAVTSTRRFPLLFFDPAIVELDPPPDLTTHWWLATAAVTDGSIDAARTGARASLLIVSIGALVLAAGLGLGAMALQARSHLVETRTDFVAAVTHELKTPTATIQTIGESFSRRAHLDEVTRREYGNIVVHEAKRLTRLVDNLLAYSRISDVTKAYSFESTSLRALVDRALDEFRFRLEADRVEVSVDLPGSLTVRADAAALSLAVGNVIDNAIRYSDDRRRLAIRARRATRETSLEIADGGIGIPAHELHKVTEKFFRGAGAMSGGTGLGLAITKQIVADHGGRLAIRSEPGVGTTVTIGLPTPTENYGDSHTDR